MRAVSVLFVCIELSAPAKPMTVFFSFNSFESVSPRCMSKRIVPLDQSMRAGDWSARYKSSEVSLLHGAQALIVGYGAIGRHLEKLCTGFGMQTQVVRRTGFTKSALNAALLKTNALLVAVPWTAQTEGMFDAERLAMLPDHATIVNVARGPVIDEDALFAELRSGRLRAGIDVWYQYPKSEDQRGATQPSKHDFGSLDNVVLSPHRAGHCEGIDAIRAQHLVKLLRADPIPNRVDLDEGY